MNIEARNSNIELYRIIVMIMIIAHHYVVNSGLPDVIHGSLVSDNTVFYSVFGSFGKTGINCFVLITGYFMCRKDISLRKLMKLLICILTYTIIFGVLFIGYALISGVFISLPISIPYGFPGLVSSNFVLSYLLFYLLIPFLNILIRNIDQKQHKRLMILVVFVSVFCSFLERGGLHYVVWFCVLYVIGSYLRLYPLKRDKDVRFWRTLTAMSLVTSILSVIAVLWYYKVSVKYPNMWLSHIMLSDSNAPLALLNAVASFMWFKNIQIKHNKWINSLASCCFGVLIIHAFSDGMRLLLWHVIFDCTGHYNTALYWIYAPMAVMIVFSVCACIELIRIKTMETPMLNWAENRVRSLLKRLKLISL